MPQMLDTACSGFETDFTALLAAKRETGADVSAATAEIIAAVRAEGDAAVLALTRKYDRLEATDMESLRITSQECSTALDRIDAGLRTALELAAERIHAFHLHQLPDGFSLQDNAGVMTAMRHGPVESAGLYVPGGKAAYPSSVLMNAIPAQVAGVSRRVMVVPCPDGVINDAVLAAAHLSGIEEIWKIGGAQAIAALAWGTESIAAVDKITGPGNAYVAAAKRQVYGQVGIDSIAGPSEILILADAANNPDWIAMDLLSQAEHDEAAQAILITDDAGFAKATATAVEKCLETLPRQAVAAAAWQNNGAIITIADWAEGCQLADRIAAEHLQIATAEPETLADRIRHAGAIFLGRHTPEAIGDYIAGPNHVLPTARTARFSSGLGVADFMKRTTLVRRDAESLARIGPAAIRLAEAEGLTAHARSISQRLTEQNP